MSIVGARFGSTAHKAGEGASCGPFAAGEEARKVNIGEQGRLCGRRYPRFPSCTLEGGRWIAANGAIQPKWLAVSSGTVGTAAIFRHRPIPANLFVYFEGPRMIT
jgi:hypothetical protein